jgi:hypothetical protein
VCQECVRGVLGVCLVVRKPGGTQESPAQPPKQNSVPVRYEDGAHNLLSN